MSIDLRGQMDIYVDASHACHEDMRGQTGGCIVMGKGVVHARSSKQTINSKSSTETELIGGSDYLPYALWHIYFLRSQGYEIDCKILYQDNESTIKLLNNGKQSSGKQTRHIDIRYFWISDRLKNEQIRVKYCSTERMLADFFTKPLTGSLFATMRDITQGILPIDELKKRHEIKIKTEENNNPGSVNHKECVGEIEVDSQNAVRNQKHVEPKHNINLRDEKQNDENIVGRNKSENDEGTERYSKSIDQDNNEKDTKMYRSNTDQGYETRISNKDRKRTKETYASILQEKIRTKN